MNSKFYADPGEFLQDNAEFFRRYEAATQLNQGNAMANRNRPCGPDLLFGRYEEAGVPVLVFGNAAPWNLCLNASAEALPLAEKAARELGGYLRTEGMAIPGVTARESLCQALMEGFGGTFVQKSAMDILVLEKLVEPLPVPGKIRRAREEDLETTFRWARAFYEEALHQSPDEEQLREKRRELIRREVLWLMENPQGEPVSMAQTSRQLAHGTAVSGVYTPPEHRGKGYAQNTVAAICRERLAAGMDYCTLFVDRLNPVSNRVYRKIGFETLEDCREYTLRNFPE